MGLGMRLGSIVMHNTTGKCGAVHLISINLYSVSPGNSASGFRVKIEREMLHVFRQHVNLIFCVVEVAWILPPTFCLLLFTLGETFTI